MLIEKLNSAIRFVARRLPNLGSLSKRPPPEENLEEDAGEDLRGYGMIWLRGEINEKAHALFTNQFNVLLEDETVEVIEIHICSPGGSYDYGMAIFEEIRLSEKPTVSIIQGGASSAGAVISQAAEKRLMTENSRLMFHPPIANFGEGSFTTQEVKVIAKKSEKIERSILEILSEKTGKTPKQLKKFIGIERNLNAEEALKHGFMDDIF